MTNRITEVAVKLFCAVCGGTLTFGGSPTDCHEIGHFGTVERWIPVQGR